MFLCASSHKCFSQTSDLEISEIIKKSDLVVEGKVIAQSAYRDESTGNIFTINEITPVEIFKYKLFVNKIYIRTEGGLLGNLKQSVSHSVQLDAFEYGIFALHLLPNESNVFEIEKGSFGKIKKIEFSKSQEGIICGKNESIPNWDIFRNEIRELCENGFKSPIKNTTAYINQSPEICFQIGKPEFDILTKQVKFDILVKSNLGNVKFSDANISVNYPIQVFGSNIASNGKISVQKQNLASNISYQVVVNDFAFNKVVASIGSNCTQYSQAFVLPTTYIKFCKVVLTIQDINSLPLLKPDDFTFSFTSRYFTTSNTCSDFGRICIERDLNQIPCSITKIEASPFGAGTHQTIKIKGSGFGGTAGVNSLAKIDIPNADDGGGNGGSGTNIVISGADSEYIINWQDDEIELLITSMAYGSNSQTMGSGKWIVNPDFSLNDETCSAIVDIDFALSNTSVGDKMISLALNNTFFPNGTFTWYLDEGIENSPLLQA